MDTNSEEMIGTEMWIEPEILDLDVAKTAAGFELGGDGQTTWSDCTLS